MPTGKYPRRPISVTFWEKVNKDGSFPDTKLGLTGRCWEWLGGVNGTGYGRCWVHGKMKASHNVSYELLNGKLSDGLELDHLCKNHSCVNPSHLEPVTHKENVLRSESIAAVNAAKTSCPMGHPYHDKTNSKGKRICLVCANEATRRYCERKKFSDSSPTLTT